jgi:hypothetical protein
MKPGKKFPRCRVVWIVEIVSNNMPSSDFSRAYRTRRAARGVSE